MNNTLTGLGLALVLALLAALIGPWFVNWTAYRDDFARQASALLGAPVRVSGAVDVRLLPTPYARFRQVSAGSPGAAIGVDEIEVELAITPLLRGEFKAERARLVRPRLSLSVQPDGSVRTAFSGGRGQGSAELLSLDRVEIVDGSATAVTPSGGYAIDKVSGLAEIGSLAGPFRFEGSVGPDRARIETRFSTTRLDDKGGMRLKLALQREGRPETFDLDGGLTVGAKPRFDGRVTFVGPAGKGAGASAEPWRAVADVKADPAVVKFENIDLVYGPDDRALRLGGGAEASLGERPSLDLSVSSRQIDLDRFLGDSRPGSPAEVIRTLTERAQALAAPHLRGRLSLDLRGVVMAGDVLQDVKAEIASEGDGWRVTRAAAKLPGGSSFTAKGAIGAAGAGFAGDVDVSSADLASLRSWLAGRAERAGPVRSVSVKGRVAASRTAVSFENATLVADGARSTGRLSWRAGQDGRRDRFEAALTADDLDLDAFGLDKLLKSAFAKGGPDAAVSLDAKALTFAGVRMADVSIDGALEDGGLDLHRLEIRDAAGASLSGAGRIAASADGSPAGNVSIDVASPRLAPLVTLARAAGAPEPLLAALETRAAALAPVKLGIDLQAGDDGEKITVSGDVAGGRLDAQLSGEGLSWQAPADLELRLASPDGARLARLAGVTVSPAVSAAGGEISLKLNGAPAKGMTGEGRFAALGIDLTGNGAVIFAPGAAFKLDATAKLSSPDLSDFGEAIGRLTPGASPKLPASLAGKVTVTQDALRIEELAGEVAGAEIGGELSVSLSASGPFGGRLAFKELPASALAALALAPRPSGGTDGRSAWGVAPFGPSAARGLAGKLEVSADRMPLVPGETATNARFSLAFRPSGLVVDELSARLDGGRLSGSANISRNGDDATVALALALDGYAVGRVAGLAPQASPATGVADVKLEAQATGRSPAALMGAFTGTGALSLREAAIRRLDVAAIDRIEPQLEKGLALEAPKVAAALEREFAAADLAFDRVSIPFTLSAGVARSGTFSAENASAKISGGVALDLRRLTLDADLVLQPKRPEAPQVGVSFEGPLAAPKRRVDATAFTGWLSVRAVERETKRIEAMEADIRERARIARLRAEEERKAAEEEKRRQEEERRKAEAERRKREAEVRALTESLPKVAPPGAPGLPSSLDITTPAPASPAPKASPPAGVFAPHGGGPGGGRPSGDAIQMPQTILPPAAASPPR